MKRTPIATNTTPSTQRGDARACDHMDFSRSGGKYAATHESATDGNEHGKLNNKQHEGTCGCPERRWPCGASSGAGSQPTDRLRTTRSSRPEGINVYPIPSPDTSLASPPGDLTLNVAFLVTPGSHAVRTIMMSILSPLAANAIKMSCPTVLVVPTQARPCPT